MELGFGPRLSRVAAGVCFILFLGALQYFFGRWVMLAIVMLPALLAVLLVVALPNSSRKRRIIRLVTGSVDITDFFMERLDDRFESLIKRLRR
ncbi:MAG TPA: hypothetical protein VE377_25035 [Candidatus Dormibacteraeota bacterium]|nr:hypothetical protein [Candidatus Dormibacteraeota bacterium]